MDGPHALDTVEFATRFLELLHSARTNTTYKYALLLALIDECQENIGQKGGPTGTTTTRRLAERVVELYWRQTTPFHRDVESIRLRQIQSGERSLVDHIAQARESVMGMAGSVHRFRFEHPTRYADLVDHVERTMIRYPIPLLQRVGRSTMEIIYRVEWGEQPPAGPIRQYQRALRRGSTTTGDWDNTIRFLPGVEHHLSTLAGLFRPLIRREWTRFVANCNGSAIEDLETFLFEPLRADLSGCRDGLMELQQGRCFYCHGRIGGVADIDHFLPWSRCMHEATDNLVLAHGPCNRAKSDHLAGRPHISAWMRRLEGAGEALASIAEAARLPFAPARSKALARSLYGSPGRTPLWLHKEEFEVISAEEALQLIA